MFKEYEPTLQMKYKIAHDGDIFDYFETNLALVKYCFSTGLYFFLATKIASLLYFCLMHFYIKI